MEIKNEKTISTTVQISNADDAARKFTVKGHAEIVEARMARINSGEVKALPDKNGWEESVADFCVNNGYALSVTVKKLDMTTAQKREVLDSVMDFIAEAEVFAAATVE